MGGYHELEVVETAGESGVGELYYFWRVDDAGGLGGLYGLLEVWDGLPGVDGSQLVRGGAVCICDQ